MVASYTNLGTDPVNEEMAALARIEFLLNHAKLY